MNLRRAIGGAVAAAGAAAIGHRLQRRRAGELENPLPGVSRTYRWRGMDVAYTVAGDPENPDLVCYHGLHAAASSEEFSPIFEALAEHYHVVAVDLPGFGRSDRPPLVYSADLYTEFVREFAADVLETPTVLASSLTGSFALSAAEEGAFERLVLVCPTADTGPERPWLRTLVRSPLVGTALFDLLASRPSLRYFLRREGYYDPDSIRPEEVAYAWATTHQPGARFAPASFVSGSLDPDFDLATELSACPVPVTLLWGREAEIVPLREGRRLAEAAGCDLAVVDYATLLPHAERPAEVAEYLAGLVE
ncbi:alpha/beta fold hydrolase [Saliphagus infecundisoli]|uniref:Alpha/beta fold hydrolase n=1 Tax=Saliphagus infecundisoli TaxID=1849069 RepID=A0ABD5QA72_9EURY|nr:alpha/beta fold hydrolase [Saliphagus infecundisoli]